MLTVVDGRIEASVSEVRGDVETLTEAVMGEDGLSVRVTTLENTGVSEVTTTTGYTFNAEGLTIYETGSNIKNLLNNEGMYVSRIIGESEESILTANTDGVDALNLHSRQFLIIGDNTLSLLIDSKRNTIINFADLVIDDTKPVTREQFHRVFKLYEEYEDIIKSNDMTNGEVDIAYRIIGESYEKRMSTHSFVEDIRGYNI